MSFLKQSIFGLFIITLSCGPSGTQSITLPVEYDTYVDQASSKNHSKRDYLKVEDASNESHALIKLPTGEDAEQMDVDSIFDDIFTNIGKVALFPMYLMTKVILGVIFGCPDGKLPQLDSNSLNTASLLLNIESAPSGDLTGAFTLEDLDQSWHSSATWNQRHQFSSSASWNKKGGSPGNELSVSNTMEDASTVEFDVTEYFRTLLDNNESGSSKKPTHFGLVLKATNTLAKTHFHSSQNTNSLGPRIYAEYDGCDPDDYESTPSSIKSQNKTGHVYFLNEDRSLKDFYSKK